MIDKLVEVRYLIEKSGKKVGDVVEVPESLAEFLVKKGDASFVLLVGGEK